MPIARLQLTRSYPSSFHNAKGWPSQQTTGPPGVVILILAWPYTSSHLSLRWRSWWWLAGVLKAGILGKTLLITEIARKYLCVSSSSASSERLFSASGNVVTKLRSSLSPENLELIVYLHENMRKVKMTYDSDLLKAPAPGQAPAQAPVQLDWSENCMFYSKSSHF